jgi:two-component system LytT family response regulator
VLIVDDEPLARRRIRALLKKSEPALSIVGESGDGLQAVQAIIKLKPDLVFLDIQMPGMNGFEVLQAVGPENMPEVIFVTAYDKYAIKAFEVDAVDYLLKPFDSERFQQALERGLGGKSQKRDIKSASGVEVLLNRLLDEKRISRRILIKSSDRIAIIRADQIDWVESAGNYVKIHVGKETHMLRETISNMEKRLDPLLFARTQRQAIINLEKVKELLPGFHGDYTVVLNNGTRLNLSRKYRAGLEKIFGDIS